MERRHPRAVLAGASTPAAWTWTGRLDALASVEPPRRLASIEAPGPSAPPAILCIGPCVALAAELGQAAGRGASLQVAAAG